MPPGAPLSGLKGIRNPQAFIAGGLGALCQDSRGLPWTGDNVFSSGDLVEDLTHNFFLETGARNNKLKVYEAVEHPAARALTGYLLVRGGVHQIAYARALENLTGADMTKLFPSPRIPTDLIPECQPHIAAGEHRVIYRMSPSDYNEIAAVFNGPHPETGEPLEVVDGPPEGAPVPEAPEQPAVFAPDYAPEEIAEIADRLRERAGIAKTPEQMPRQRQRSHGRRQDGRRQDHPVAHAKARAGAPAPRAPGAPRGAGLAGWPRMRILVTGSAGHLGEALVSVLGADGHDVAGLDLLPSPHTPLLGLRRRRGPRPPRPRRRRRRRPRRDPAQAARRDAYAPGVRRDERDGHADPARGRRRGRGGPLRVHEHHERVRACADAAARRPRGVDHRGRRTRAPQRLRRDEDRRGGPVRARAPRPRAARGGAADGPVLPGARRRRRPADRLRRPQPQGQRAPVPPGRPRGRRGGPPAGAGARAGHRVRPARRERDDAVRAGDLDELREDAPAVVHRRFPDQEAIYTARGWRMLPGIDRVYVNARAREVLGWSPRHDFRRALDALAAGGDPRSPLAARVGAKGYHRAPVAP